jgi:26S proteasome regulatory subunit T1
MTPTQISDFLDGTIRNRISVRLIAEQHIAISQAIRNSKPPTSIGVVDLHCSPIKTIKSCESFVKELCDATLGESPAVVIDGHTDSAFA